MITQIPSGTTIYEGEDAKRKLLSIAAEHLGLGDLPEGNDLPMEYDLELALECITGILEKPEPVATQRTITSWTNLG